MRHLVIIIPLLFALLSPLPGYATTTLFNNPDISSVSNSESAFASMQNPAFADISPISFAYRFMSFDSKKAANHLCGVNLAGFSLVYGRYDNIYNDFAERIDSSHANYYNISKGFFFDNTFGIGAGYSFSTSKNNDYNGYRSWTLGFLLRPSRFFSIGVSIDRLGAAINGESLDRQETYSVSLRPLTNRITVSVDGMRTANQPFSRIDYATSINIRFVYDISLYLKADDTKNFVFGITVPFVSNTTNSSMLHFTRTNYHEAANYNAFGISYPRDLWDSAIPLHLKKSLVELTFNQQIRENAPVKLFSERTILLYDIIQAIEKARDDSLVEGIILKIDDVNLGFAQLQELRDALRRFKKSGKKIYAIITEPGNKEYYLAAIADNIIFAPNSTFHLTGLSANVYFFKELMAKVGLRFESIKKGTYKSFFESYTRNSMSKPARSNLEAVLSDINHHYITDIMRDRNISLAELNSIFDIGVLTPEEALQKKLIDRIAYYTEAKKSISDGMAIIKMEKYIDSDRKDHNWGAPPSIAIIHVTGSIIKGNGSQPQNLELIDDSTYANLLESAFKNPSIKAIIIRIDSGGGSALASDLMWKSLNDMKKISNKPVVFSVGNAAASGGYYIACSGDKIFANRSSIVGSIGVIFGKLSMKELYAKLGINKETIKTHNLADIFSESREFTNKEKDIIQKGINYSYNQFISKVMKARNIDSNTITNIAEGKVFTGLQGKSHKLVDHMGGLFAAINFITHKTGIKNYKVIHLPEYSESLFNMLKPDLNFFTKSIVRTLMNHTDYYFMRNEQYLYLFPYKIEIK